MRQRAMQQDNSWDRAAAAYEDLYLRRLRKTPRPPVPGLTAARESDDEATPNQATRMGVSIWWSLVSRMNARLTMTLNKATAIGKIRPA